MGFKPTPLPLAGFFFYRRQLWSYRGGCGPVFQGKPPPPPSPFCSKAMLSVYACMCMLCVYAHVHVCLCACVCVVWVCMCVVLMSTIARSHLALTIQPTELSLIREAVALSASSIVCSSWNIACMHKPHSYGQCAFVLHLIKLWST